MADLTESQLASIFSQHLGKEFVSRIFNPASSPAPIQNEGGSISTHRMAAEVDENGNWSVFPTIINEDGVLVQKTLREAQDHARTTGEAIPFGKNKDAALSFSKDYKKVSPINFISGADFK